MHSSPSRLPHAEPEFQSVGSSDEQIEERRAYEDPGETGSSNGQEHDSGFPPPPNALGRIAGAISDGELVAAHVVP